MKIIDLVHEIHDCEVGNIRHVRGPLFKKNLNVLPTINLMDNIVRDIDYPKKLVLPYR